MNTKDIKVHLQAYADELAKLWVEADEKQASANGFDRTFCETQTTKTALTCCFCSLKNFQYAISSDFMFAEGDRWLEQTSNRPLQAGKAEGNV